MTGWALGIMIALSTYRKAIAMKIKDYIHNATDSQLEALMQQIRTEREARRQRQAADKLAHIKEGTRFTLTNIRPKYLEGVVVKVTGFDGQWIIVDIIRGDSGRFSRTGLRCRTTHIGTILPDPEGN